MFDTSISFDQQLRTFHSAKRSTDYESHSKNPPIVVKIKTWQQLVVLNLKKKRRLKSILLEGYFEQPMQKFCTVIRLSIRLYI